MSSPRPTAPQTIPKVISARGPKRSISGPQNGEMKTIGAVIGRTSSPAATGAVAEDSWRYWGWKKITAQ